MDKKRINTVVNVEDLTFYVSIICAAVMSALFLADAGKPIVHLPLITITTAGMFGLIAAFSYGWHASRRGRPNAGQSKHLLFAAGLALTTLILFYFGSTVFEAIVSRFS